MRISVIPNRQSGAALIVGLVLLMVLTVLAISTMRTATLETAMAGNAQYRQKAVEAAQAGIADVMADIDDGILNLDPVPAPINLAPVAVIEQTSGDQVGTYTVTIKYIGRSVPVGKDAGTFVDQNYEIESTGTSARNAQSVQRQGIKILELL